MQEALQRCKVSRLPSHALVRSANDCTKWISGRLGNAEQEEKGARMGGVLERPPRKAQNRCERKDSLARSRRAQNVVPWIVEERHRKQGPCEINVG